MKKNKSYNVKIVRKNIPKEELIEDLVRVANKLGSRKISGKQYDKHGEFCSETFRNKFGSWFKALELAGLEGHYSRSDITKFELLENIANVWSELGKQPSYQNMTDKQLSKFTVGMYISRFGSWSKALLEFSKYIESENVLYRNEKYLQSKTVKKKTLRNINWRIRAQILIRDNCICQMCGASPAKDSEIVLHVDHIKPWSKGGETVPENLQTLCSKCNIGKSNVL